MRHIKGTNTLVWSNCTLNLTTLTAHSYGWWKFVDNIGGLIVFNTYTYSITTSAHQRKVRQVLRELHPSIVLHEVECPDGLQNLSSGMAYMQAALNAINDELATMETRKRQAPKRKATLIAKRDDMLDKIITMRTILARQKRA